jgi:hypothetical protein
MQVGKAGYLQFVDMTGRLVVTRSFDDTENEIVIDVHSLAPGTYTVLISSDENRYEERVVIIEN